MQRRCRKRRIKISVIRFQFSFLVEIAHDGPQSSSLRAFEAHKLNQITSYSTIIDARYGQVWPAVQVPNSLLSTTTQKSPKPPYAKKRSTTDPVYSFHEVKMTKKPFQKNLSCVKHDANIDLH